METVGHTKQLVLRKKEERRVLSGHPWVFSNEVRETRGEPAVGDLVELLTDANKSLGFGFYHPHSLISFRLLTRESPEINTEFFCKRISTALELRRILYPGSGTFRVVHSEADFLPGLIVDKYNDYLCVQTLSAGMDARLDMVCDALESLFHPAAIIERNESPLRALEHLPQQKRVLRGTAGVTTVTELGLRFEVDPFVGQKTGFYLDQCENRAAIRRFAANAHVLDCFCNEGGFGLHAAAAGAASVLGIDSSEEAIERAKRNSRENNLTSVRFTKGDVFEELKKLFTGGQAFDLVVLDPPSFTRSRKHVPTAKRGYRELHESALRVLKRGGILVTASCSHHIQSDVFLDTISDAAGKFRRRLQLLEWRGAAPDHPTLPAVPETQYLKLGIFRVH